MRIHGLESIIEIVLDLFSSTQNNEKVRQTKTSSTVPTGFYATFEFTLQNLIIQKLD